MKAAFEGVEAELESHTHKKGKAESGSCNDVVIVELERREEGRAHWCIFQILPSLHCYYFSYDN
jgi:hypothetical protein